MQLADIARAIDAQPNDIMGDIDSICIDSRKCTPGSLFIAIKGENFDGHTFVRQAAQQGAVAAVISQPCEATIPTLLVEDTRHALGAIAKAHAAQFAIPKVALTGSNGKTTTKQFLASILSQFGNTLASQGNFNNDIGVPLSLLQLRAEHDFAVFECGTNHAGEIAAISRLIQPDVAIVTHIGPNHIENLGSLENISKEKSSIYQFVSENGIAVINNDEPFASSWDDVIGARRRVTFALHHDADVSAKACDYHQQHTTFTLQTPQGEVVVNLPCPGEHNVMNALAASAAAIALDVPLEAIQYGLECAENVGGRLQIQAGKNQSRIIDDTYNASLASVKAAIAVLANYPGERVLVFGDMAELGKHASAHHHAVGEEAQRLGIDALYTVGKHSALATAAFGGHSQHFDTQTQLIDSIIPCLQAQTTVLVKGSRSSHMETIVQALIEE